jgi:hypothetical protein
MIVLQHGRCGVRCPGGSERFFVSFQNVQIQSGAHRAPLQCVLFFIGGVAGGPEHEVDHSPPLSAEVKN